MYTGIIRFSPNIYLTSTCSRARVYNYVWMSTFFKKHMQFATIILLAVTMNMHVPWTKPEMGDMTMLFPQLLFSFHVTLILWILQTLSMILMFKDVLWSSVLHQVLKQSILTLDRKKLIFLRDHMAASKSHRLFNGIFEQA